MSGSTQSIGQKGVVQTLCNLFDLTSLWGSPGPRITPEQAQRVREGIKNGLNSAPTQHTFRLLVLLQSPLSNPMDGTSTASVSAIASRHLKPTASGGGM